MRSTTNPDDEQVCNMTAMFLRSDRKGRAQQVDGLLEQMEVVSAMRSRDAERADRLQALLLQYEALTSGIAVRGAIAS